MTNCYLFQTKFDFYLSIIFILYYIIFTHLIKNTHGLVGLIELKESVFMSRWATCRSATRNRLIILDWINHFIWVQHLSCKRRVSSTKVSVEISTPISQWKFFKQFEKFWQFWVLTHSKCQYSIIQGFWRVLRLLVWIWYYVSCTFVASPPLLKST